MRRHFPRIPTDDVNRVFEDLLSSDPESGSEAPEYGVHAKLQGRVVTLVLTFLGGETYCCADPACHLGLDGIEAWERLREILEDNALDPPRPLTVRCQTAVHEDARFDASCSRSAGSHGSGSTEPTRAVFEES